jgi:ferrochelatase
VKVSAIRTTGITSKTNYIACLNDSPIAIDALAAVATQHLSGWDTHTAPDVTTLAHSRSEALALGAKN